ncbi:hypothetical protein ACFV2N_06365 [Streptomyces sp. NPDC059680]|uniref:hypothetical protein n=1 Tax=Streptomyces TaxID=1883 RepID=UPI001E45505C|nr:hypothetical protein [Streptomyces barringtoniae]MCC5474224.1 hypothetical protein [Streptomyces barringtoniae]
MSCRHGVDCGNAAQTAARDMAGRDAWPAGALKSLGETGRGVPALTAGLMERLGTGALEADDRAET